MASTSEQVVYAGNKTPFIQKHVLGEETIALTYLDLAQNFTPELNTPIVVGDYVCDTSSGVSGPVIKISKKYKNKRGVFYTLQGAQKSGRNKISPKSQYVKTHSINEFVRNKQSLHWYCVKVRHSDHIECHQVFEPATEAAAKKKKTPVTKAAAKKTPESPPPKKVSAKRFPSPNSWRARKVKTLGDDIPVYMMPPKYVLTDEQKLEEYVAYHKDHLPDTSHFPTHNPAHTHFWKLGKPNRIGRKRKGSKTRAKSHSILTGLHCTNVNESLDYCIQNNKWCVRFMWEDKAYDLIEDFTVRFWVKYTSKMVCMLVSCVLILSSTVSYHLQTGHPLGTQKSAQLVLEYLVCNPKLIANAWRGKLYRFSSGSLFKQICTPLTEHLAGSELFKQKMLQVRRI